MEYFIVCFAALVGSGLTLFSGFGLGTILVPVFALFFPIEIAIALTAIVHFLNNLFKLILVGRNADKSIVLRFGIPAVFSALLGAYLLTLLTYLKPLWQYSIGLRQLEIMPIKLVIAILIIAFVLFDYIPRFANLQFDKKYLVLGGFLSGFFGGISGNQGALRSAFLIKANLKKEVFIATGVVIACLIDVFRLTIYSKQILKLGSNLDFPLLLSATISFLCTVLIISIFAFLFFESIKLNL
ncbi:MAG: TSUP family transporter [Flavobacterium sp.]|nr:TSUP family transporter [Flavobacterium sp.]